MFQFLIFLLLPSLFAASSSVDYKYAKVVECVDNYSEFVDTVDYYEHYKDDRIFKNLTLHLQRVANSIRDFKESKAPMKTLPVLTDVNHRMAAAISKFCVIVMDCFCRNRKSPLNRGFVFTVVKGFIDFFKIVVGSSDNYFGIHVLLPGFWFH